MTKPDGQDFNWFQIQRQSSAHFFPSTISLEETTSETKTAFILWLVSYLVSRIQVLNIFPPFVHFHPLTGFLSQCNWGKKDRKQTFTWILRAVPVVCVCVYVCVCVWQSENVSLKGCIRLVIAATPSLLFPASLSDLCCTSEANIPLLINCTPT